MKLTPMPSGDTAGIAIWLDKAGAEPINISGSNNLTVTGVIYAPASTVSWAGSGSSPCTQLVAYNMFFSGSSTFQHNCSLYPGVTNVASAAGYKLGE